jgi:hypothetical protein
MARKPTRRGIRRRATRNRSGGTVYQNDHALDSAFAAVLADQPAGDVLETPAHARRLADAEQDTISPTDVVEALVALLDWSGWKRLEVCRAADTPRVTGYCVDAESNRLHVADLI